MNEREKEQARSNGRRLVRLKAAARYLSISVAQLRTRIQRGEIPCIPQGDHAIWLVDIEDLDDWIRKSKVDFS